MQAAGEAGAAAGGVAAAGDHLWMTPLSTSAWCVKLVLTQGVRAHFPEYARARARAHGCMCTHQAKLKTQRASWWHRGEHVRAARQIVSGGAAKQRMCSHVLLLPRGLHALCPVFTGHAWMRSALSAMSLAWAHCRHRWHHGCTRHLGMPSWSCAIMVMFHTRCQTGREAGCVQGSLLTRMVCTNYSLSC